MIKPVKYFLFFSLLIFAQQVEFAQTRKIDSLMKVLRTTKEDSVKVILGNKISFSLYLIGNYDSAMSYAQRALHLAEKLNSPSEKARAHNNLGICHTDKGNYSSALKELDTTMKLFEKTGIKIGIGNTHNNIGIVYKEQGNYPEALKEYFSALKIRELLNDKQGIAASHLNIGLVLASQGNIKETLKEYESALKIFEEIGDKRGIGFCHTNMGVTYSDLKNYSKALSEQEAALKTYKETDDKEGIADAHNNIGEVYERLGNNAEALKEYYSSLKIKELIGDKEGTCSTLINIGEILIKLRKPKEGKLELEKSLAISKEIGSKERIKESYAGLAKADSTLGNYRSAFENFKMYIQCKDSLLNEDNTKKTVRLQMNFEFDKKQAADSVRNSEIAKQENLKHEQEIKQQKIFTYGGLAGFILMLVIAGISFRAYKNKQKANEIISRQKHLVEEKQKEILDSIHYAKRIQTALLPTEKYIAKKLKG